MEDRQSSTRENCTAWMSNSWSSSASQPDREGRRHGHAEPRPRQRPQRVRRPMPTSKQDGCRKCCAEPAVATANHGRQRDEETRSKLRASEVPMVACPLGYGLLNRKPSESKASSGTSLRHGSTSLRNSEAHHRASKSRHRDYTGKSTAAHGCNDNQDRCRNQQRPLTHKAEDVGVKLYNIPTQGFASKDASSSNWCPQGRLTKTK